MEFSSNIFLFANSAIAHSEVYWAIAVNVRYPPVDDTDFPLLRRIKWLGFSEWFPKFASDFRSL